MACPFTRKAGIVLRTATDDTEAAEWNLQISLDRRTPQQKSVQRVTTACIKKTTRHAHESLTVSDSDVLAAADWSRHCRIVNRPRYCGRSGFRRLVHFWTCHSQAALQCADQRRHAETQSRQDDGARLCWHWTTGQFATVPWNACRMNIAGAMVRPTSSLSTACRSRDQPPGGTPSLSSECSRQLIRTTCGAEFSEQIAKRSRFLEGQKTPI